METVTRPPPHPVFRFEWATAARAMPGEAAIGDRSHVVPFEGGILIAAMDGLGHGREAAASAEIASAVLTRDPGENAIDLIRRCHRALTGERGVAMSLASIDTRRGQLTWISVGNVEGILVQSGADGKVVRSRLVTRGGVVGSALPPLRAEVLSLTPGDLVMFTTDGIDQRFADSLARDTRSPQEIANGVLAHYAKPTDDALVLVARVMGPE